MDVGFKSDKGKIRSKNEDSFYIMKEKNFFVVADGVGGNRAGEIASSTAAKEIAALFYSKNTDSFSSERDVENFMLECVESVNHRILSLSQEKEENNGMATTLVVAYFYKKKLLMMNIGDSRGYILRDGKLLQITEDHTYVNTLLQAGIISEEEAQVHEGKHMITRAIGAEDSIEADIFNVGVRNGDIIMICTDGLYGEVSDEEIRDRLTLNESMQFITDSLVESAIIHGGHDNITVICVKITEEDDI